MLLGHCVRCYLGCVRAAYELPQGAYETQRLCYMTERLQGGLVFAAVIVRHCMWDCQGRI